MVSLQYHCRPNESASMLRVLKAVAINELTKIAMDLQDNILKALYFALEDDSFSIGSRTTDSSDDNRIKTIVALGELCQRLARRETAVETLPVAWSPLPQTSNIASPFAVAPNSSRRMSATAPELARRFSAKLRGGYTTISDNRRMSDFAPEVVVVPLSPPAVPRANSAKKSPASEDASEAPSYLPSMAWFRKRSKSAKSIDRISPPEEECPRNSSYFTQRGGTPRAERSPSQSFRTYVTQTANFRRTNSGSFPAIAEGDHPIDDTLSAQGTDSDNTGTWTSGASVGALSHLSTSSACPQLAQSVFVSSSLLRVPRVENNHLGFCKGASELQRGNEDAFNEEQEWAFGKVPYLMCSQCAFTGRISYTKVWETTGMRFRWTFLAKSHVSQKKVSDNIHAYICMFCVFQGFDATVIQGSDSFLNHVAEHRADDFSDILLERTRCINFRAATDDEDFDINLIPFGKDEVEYRKRSATSPKFLQTQFEPIPLVEAPTQSPVEAPTEPMDRDERAIYEQVPWPYFR